MTFPARFSDALSSRQPRPDAADYQTASRKLVRRGDIRRVEPCFKLESAFRLALVLTVDRDKNSAEVMLVHPYVELATETDLVLQPDETVASYPIVVETRVRSAVWILQIGERVGCLSENVLEEISKVAAAASPFAVSLRTGPPVAGPADSRWNLKRQEASTLNELAADRIASIFENRIDPQWLPSISQDSEFSSLVDELAVHPSEWTLEDLDTLQDCAVFDSDTYIAPFGRDLVRDLDVSYQPCRDKAFAIAARTLTYRIHGK